MKLPRWDCRDPKDQKLFEEWTNARLDEIDAEFDAALEALEDKRQRDNPHIPIRNALDDGQSDNQCITIRNHKVAVKNIDGERYVRLADLEPLLRPESRKRGRPKSKARLFKFYFYSGAAEDIDRIRKIWHDHYKKQNRSDSNSPTAFEIAARRHGIELNVLRSYLSNRRR